SEEDPVTLKAMSILGILYSAQGKYEQAEPLVSKSLEIARRVCGEESSITMSAMSCLGWFIYAQQGRYAEAETLLTKAVEISRRVFGDDNPVSKEHIYPLAQLYQYQGKPTQAESLFTKSLEGYRLVSGEGVTDN